MEEQTHRKLLAAARMHYFLEFPCESCVGNKKTMKLAIKTVAARK
jgi:hypothetical protein